MTSKKRTTLFVQNSRTKAHEISMFVSKKTLKNAVMSRSSIVFILLVKDQLNKHHRALRHQSCGSIVLQLFGSKRQNLMRLRCVIMIQHVLCSWRKSCLPVWLSVCKSVHNCLIIDIQRYTKTDEDMQYWSVIQSTCYWHCRVCSLSL